MKCGCLKKELGASKAATHKYKCEGAALELVLREARRRTIPMRGGGSVNFLPYEVTQVNKTQDSHVVQGWSGAPVVVYGRVEVTICCEGDVVENRP